MPSFVNCSSLDSENYNFILFFNISNIGSNKNSDNNTSTNLEQDTNNNTNSLINDGVHIQDCRYLFADMNIFQDAPKDADNLITMENLCGGSYTNREEDKANKNKADKNKADKNKVDKNKADKNKADINKADENKADKDKDEKDKDKEDIKGDKNKDEEASACCKIEALHQHRAYAMLLQSNSKHAGAFSFIFSC